MLAVCAGLVGLSIVAFERRLVVCQLRWVGRWSAPQRLSEAAAERPHDWRLALAAALSESEDEALGLYVRAANAAPPAERGAVYLCALRHALGRMRLDRSAGRGRREMGPTEEEREAARADAEYWLQAARQADGGNGYVWTVAAYLAVLDGDDAKAAASFRSAANTGRFDNGERVAWEARVYALGSLGLIPPGDPAAAILLGALPVTVGHPRPDVVGVWLRRTCENLAQAGKVREALSLAAACASVWQRAADAGLPWRGPSGQPPLLGPLRAVRNDFIWSREPEAAIAAARLADMVQAAWMQADRVAAGRRQAFYEQAQRAFRTLLVRAVGQGWLVFGIGCGLGWLGGRAVLAGRRGGKPEARAVRGSVAGRTLVVGLTLAGAALSSAGRVAGWRQEWRLSAEAPLFLPLLGDNLPPLLGALVVFALWTALQPMVARRWRENVGTARAVALGLVLTFGLFAALTIALLSAGAARLLPAYAVWMVGIAILAIVIAGYVLVVAADAQRSGGSSAEQPIEASGAATFAYLCGVSAAFAASVYLVTLVWDAALVAGFTRW